MALLTGAALAMARCCEEQQVSGFVKPGGSGSYSSPPNGAPPSASLASHHAKARSHLRADAFAGTCGWRHRITSTLRPVMRGIWDPHTYKYIYIHQPERADRVSSSVVDVAHHVWFQSMCARIPLQACGIRSHFKHVGSVPTSSMWARIPLQACLGLDPTRLTTK